MAESSIHSGIFVPTFFDRYGLSSIMRDEFFALTMSRHPGPIQPAPFQGYCSYTVFAGEEFVVQLRPSVFTLDITMIKTACSIFGSLAPETEYLGQLREGELHVFSMKKIPGVSLLDFRAISTKTSARKQVICDFARLQALAWQHAKRPRDVHGMKGKVGSSLKWRLEQMSTSLPIRFRWAASSILDDIADIEALPWVCTHGDFLAANIMVDSESGQLTGLLDWAEAEWLPFGVGMYGLEELLGEDDQNGQFVYYPEADYLRGIFWSQLLVLIPELIPDSRGLALVKKAQILGFLLWYGIAFDDGQLNRVVIEGRDDREIRRLSLFFSHTSSLTL